MADDEDLDRRIQALPQELQDEILDHVLFIEPGEVTINTASYKPPWQLRINRATRKKVAAHYYMTFTFKIRDKELGPWSLAVLWLRSLTGDHQGMVSDIRGDYRSGAGLHRLDFVPSFEALVKRRPEQNHAFREAKKISAWLRDEECVNLGDGVFKTNYFDFELCPCGRGECTEHSVEEHWASEKGKDV
ncbi:hypothetical protein PRZ48_014281 [Zasmidium cellare]|uniref:Uncharacterized protein n=1 Tax=Zasmidium cellare TaxID=395010 RepID=A0ABR0E0I0_ZASCE|nr:hypothetical protein PRZ48_014281 [Zasmidium cellare]